MTSGHEHDQTPPDDAHTSQVDDANGAGAAPPLSPPPDVVAAPRTWSTRRYKRFTGETSPMKLAVIALMLSVLVHVAAGMVVGKLPLGELEGAAADEARPYRIHRPLDDPIFSDPVLTSGGGERQTLEQPSLANVSRMLLLNKHEPSVPDSDPPPPARPDAHTDVQPEPTEPDLASLAKVDLPSDVKAMLSGAASVELPFDAGGTAGNTTRPGTNTAGPSAADQAASLLTGANIGVGARAVNPPVTQSGPPIVADTGPRIDRSQLLERSAAPPIEVAAITIREAIQLDVPQRLDDDFDYRVSIHRPMIKGGLFQPDKPDRYTYFRVDITAKRSLRKLKTMPKDVVFIIDTSGSVPQEWVDSVVRGVRDGLGSLNEGDRFNIVFFSDKPSFFSADKIKPADAPTIAAAQRFLTAARSKGDTDVNRAMSRLLLRDLSSQRAYYLVLISDGVPTRGVMDTRELINLITRDNDLLASIYCVGVGPRQNHELLDFLAYRNKGFSVFTKKSDEASTALRGLLSRIRYPLIKDVDLNVIGLDMEDVVPHHLPNIHQGERFSVFGRYETPVKFTIRLSGHNGVKNLDLTFTRDLRVAPQGDKTIPPTWAHRKVHHLYSEIIRKGADADHKKQMDELKKRFKLDTLY